jgi:hypothetical protein
MDSETAARSCCIEVDTCDFTARYQHQKRLGDRLDGLDVQAFDRLISKNVVILATSSILRDESDHVFCHTKNARPKRLIRHLKLLRHFRKHENIACIEDVYATDASFEDIHVVSDPMDTNLRWVICSPQQLSDDHCRFLLYQILRGLKYTPPPLT